MANTTTQHPGGDTTAFGVLLSSASQFSSPGLVETRCASLADATTACAVIEAAQPGIVAVVVTDTGDGWRTCPDGLSAREWIDRFG